MIEKSKREEIIELVNKLFRYTDEQRWKDLLADVFTETVVFDMTSMGGQPAAKVPATQITQNWEEGFKGIDAVFHQSGNFIVKFQEEGQAEVFCYATALHYKDAAQKGPRSFYGTYEIMCVLTDLGWRITGLRYNLKFISGNKELR